jgi:hypothetical protein
MEEKTLRYLNGFGMRKQTNRLTNDGWRATRTEKVKLSYSNIGPLGMAPTLIVAAAVLLVTVSKLLPQRKKPHWVIVTYVR